MVIEIAGFIRGDKQKTVIFSERTPLHAVSSFFDTLRVLVNNDIANWGKSGNTAC